MTDTPTSPAVDQHGGPGPRGLTFGAVAEDYDRFRPSYPAELIADVRALLPGRRVVEIGAGTGIATSLLATHDLDITCVEPDPEMAGLLRRKFNGNHAVRVTVATLETWAASRTPGDAPYDGLISAQAWHWTAAETRWRDAAAALCGGGLIALFWNSDGYADPAVRALIGEAYDRHGIEDRAVPAAQVASEDTPGWYGKASEWRADQVDAPTWFTDLEIRRYEWTRRHSVADHVARLNTVSAHLILPPDVREALSRDLLDALGRHTDGDVELAMSTALVLARRR